MSNQLEDRQINEVPFPEANLLTEKDLFNGSTGLPSISRLRKHLEREGRLDEQCALKLVHQVHHIFRQEANIIEIDRPLTIVADIHGQFYDLLTILSIGGEGSTGKYLFLGDYVDRGQFQSECLFLLFALKIKYPKNIFLLRGNHETRQMTRRFQFRLECKKKHHSYQFYRATMEAFDALPICALVDQRYLCMHAGLSPNIRTLQDIKSLDRFQETPKSGPLCDLLWSDPREDFDEMREDQPDFVHNTTRHCSYFFSYRACRDFLLRNKLVSIIRGHEVQKNGVRFFRQSSTIQHPVLISLFSAPNYCDTYNNIAAILQLGEDQQLKTIRFKARLHPFVLPNFENAFEFGERFLLYYTTNLLLSILNLYSPNQLAAEDGRQDKTTSELMVKKQLIQTMDKAYDELKKTNKIALNLQGLTPSYKIYKRLLARPDIQQLIEQAQTGQVHDYDQAIALDQIFERRPGT